MDFLLLFLLQESYSHLLRWYESGLPPVGAILPLSDNQGNNFQAFVVEITPEVVVADLNHPMAGKVLDFQVEVLNTRPATEEELAHGHAHGVDGTDAH